MRNISTGSLAVAFVLSGCVGDQAATLFQGTYQGQSAYAATLAGNGQGLAGAAAMTATDDGDTTMALGSGCLLYFEDVMLATDSRGQGTSATAMLAGPSCVVPVDGGTAIFDATTGSAISTGGTSLQVSVGGNLSMWLAQPTTGYITVTFQGALLDN
jgi:hypothetical protein